MPELESLSWIIEAGTSVMLFVVWYLTFKLFNETTKEISKDHNEALKSLSKEASTAYKDAIAATQEQNREVMKLFKETQLEHQEVYSHLVRILSRMEEKLDQPVRCPSAISARNGD